MKCPRITRSIFGRRKRLFRISKPTHSAIGSVGCAIGNGLLSGLIGTMAITGAQMIEMRLTKREPSGTPQRAGGTVLGVRPTSEHNSQRFGLLVHWFYGTIWGIPRGFLSFLGLRSRAANLLHFLGIWLSGMIILPVLKASTPPWKWGLKSLLTDGILHVVYAGAAGLFYQRVLSLRRK